jgi:uncharacterized protein YkwD
VPQGRGALRAVVEAGNRLRAARAVAWLVAGALALATACTTTTASRPTPAPRVDAAPEADAALETAIHGLVNAHRQDRGLPPLSLDARITRAARLHSVAMALGKAPLGHGGFAERTKMFGAPRRAAENVAYDEGHADPAREIVQIWLRSREHLANIEGPYDHTGIGAARNAAGTVYVTQMFVGSAP